MSLYTEAISVGGGGPSNGNLIAPSSLKFERRRTVSMRKAFDGRVDDGSRFSGATPEIREVKADSFLSKKKK